MAVKLGDEVADRGAVDPVAVEVAGDETREGVALLDQERSLLTSEQMGFGGIGFGDENEPGQGGVAL